jgi:aspartokinase/homoserine dehydrogenase 1
MKVLKFGGTSVGSVNSIKTLLDILKEENKNGSKPVVVLSAMSGITNLLVSMAEGAAAGKEFTAELAELERRHFEVVKALLDIQNQNPAYTRLKIHFNQLEELLQGVLTLRELTAKTRDTILSYGERCSAMMISKIAAQALPRGNVC